MKAVRAEISILALATLPYLVRATCYDTGGNLQTSFYPCNSSLEVSTCCNGTDYCLSNGLCFDDAENNVMTQQGCTDPNWGSPCHKFCSPGKSCRGEYVFLEAFNHTTEVGTEIAVIPCDQSWSGGGYISYCCQPDAADCCSKSAWGNIPVGTIIRNPISTSTSAVSTSSSLFGSISSQTATTSASQTVAQSASSTPSADSGSLRIGLGVGLGVGLPIALALIGLLGFLVWEVRKKNQRQAAADSTEIREGMQALPKPELQSYSHRQELSASA
jgi:hypothetical protein